MDDSDVSGVVGEKITMKEEKSNLSLFAKIRRDAEHSLCGPLYAQPLEWNVIRVLRLLIYPNFQITVWYRVANYLQCKGLSWFAYFLYVHMIKAFSCDIHPMAKIGAGLRIEHCSDIVIGPDVILGEDNMVFNGVTLGKRLRKDGVDGMPDLGDRVLIGTGAKLLGLIKIGSDAKIGANSVVLKDVPEGCSAVGNPARILSSVNKSTVAVEISPMSNTLSDVER